MPHTAIEQTLSINRFATYRQAIVHKTGIDCPLNTIFQNSLSYSDRQLLLNAINGNYHSVGKLLPELNVGWLALSAYSAVDG